MGTIKQVADLRPGPRRGEGPGTNAEGLRPPKKFTEQRV